MIHSGQYTPLKLHLSVSDQLSLIKSRGMAVADDFLAQKTLERIGYYRLAGYWYPFRKTKPPGNPGRLDDFQAGSVFTDIECLYDFDRQLRLLVMDAAERVEVAIRADIAHLLGRRNRLAHQAKKELDSKFCNQVNHITGITRYDEWHLKLSEATRKSKEDFVQHHITNYSGAMPIWVIVELWDFGQLSKFFAGMQYKDQSYIAKKYGLPEGKYLVSWLRAINLARNVSAHHSRLWNRNITELPKFPPTQANNRLFHLVNDSHAQTRIYGTLCIIRYLLRTISPNDDWVISLKALALKFPNSPLVKLGDAGFTLNWAAESLWN